MIKKTFKLIIFFLFILSGAFLWGRGKRPSPYLKWGELDSQKPRFNQFPGVLIIFNSGGWGNTAFEEAEDFAKVIRGIKETLNRLGWRAAIVSYGRTKDSFLGRIQGMKEVLSSFKFQSEKLANQIKIFLEHNPKSKVLMTGLSLGAYFVGETMKKIDGKTSVFAIQAGTPFWGRSLRSKNILELINEKDIAVTGDYKALFSVMRKGVARWIAAKIKGHKLSISNAIQVPGHRYDWKSTRVRKEIISFLENNFIWLKPKAGGNYT